MKIKWDVKQAAWNCIEALKHRFEIENLTQNQKLKKKNLLKIKIRKIKN